MSADDRHIRHRSVPTVGGRCVSIALAADELRISDGYASDPHCRRPFTDEDAQEDFRKTMEGKEGA